MYENLIGRKMTIMVALRTFAAMTVSEGHPHASYGDRLGGHPAS